MITMATVQPDAAYAWGVVRALSGRGKEGWNAEGVNRSGLRATFRRWKPGGPQEIMSRMLMHVIGVAQLPDPHAVEGAEADGAANNFLGRVPDWQIEHARQAAIVVAMRAAAGEHEPPQAGSLGAALAKAGMTELRLMRVLATPRNERAEALKRAYMLLDAKGIGIRWGEKEVGRILSYLFGDESGARRSITQWGADFFASRAAGASGGDSDDNSSSDQSTINTEEN